MSGKAKTAKKGSKSGSRSRSGSPKGAAAVAAAAAAPAAVKTIFFAFGRMNPPTIGHELLIKSMLKLAPEGATRMVAITRTEDDMENPLPPDVKQRLVQKLVPAGVEVRLVQSAWPFIKSLRSDGFTSINMVVGEEDKAKFASLESADVHILSGGVRSGKEGAEGARASNVRLGALGLMERTEKDARDRLPVAYSAEDVELILLTLRTKLNKAKVLKAAEKKKKAGALSGGTRRTRRGTSRR